MKRLVSRRLPAPRRRSDTSRACAHGVPTAQTHIRFPPRMDQLGGGGAHGRLSVHGCVRSSSSPVERTGPTGDRELLRRTALAQLGSSGVNATPPSARRRCVAAHTRLEALRARGGSACVGGSGPRRAREPAGVERSHESHASQAAPCMAHDFDPLSSPMVTRGRVQLSSGAQTPPVRRGARGPAAAPPALPTTRPLPPSPSPEFPLVPAV